MSWNPNQYLKFEAERFAPFDDLVRLVHVQDNLHVVDLGCGTGELTLKLAGMVPGARVLGIDNSKEMLAKAERGNTNQANVSFKLMSIEEFAEETPPLDPPRKRGGDHPTSAKEKFDLMFSNAAIHWAADHPQLLAKLWERLKPGGQIAVQIPSGVRNRAQRAVMETAEREPYLESLAGWRWNYPVLQPDEYAEVLYSLGASDIVAFEKVYPHLLLDGEAVFDWVAGTTMNAYLKRLPDNLQAAFKADVKAEVVRRYPDSPAFFPFRRIFFAGRKQAV